jgi:short-subunit dehydrogenase
MDHPEVVVITGGGSGLGEAIARKLAAPTREIVLVGRTEAGLKRVADDISRSGNACSYYVCDLRDTDQIKKIFDAVISDKKRVDILVNNAGIWFEGPTDTHTGEKVRELFAVNAVAPVEIVKAVVGVMKRQGRGQILNVVSTAGVEPDGGWGVYTATKHAVRGFTESLSRELAGTGIRVMAVYPGGMDTELFLKSGFAKGTTKEPWMMDKTDVAEVVAFMLTRPADLAMTHVEVRKAF